MSGRGEMKYISGMVITPTVESSVTNLVFRMENNEAHIYHVLPSAFRLNSEDIAVNTKNEFDISANLKNAVRRKGRPLNVGDWISWKAGPLNTISEFAREAPLFETRCISSCDEFCVPLVKSPTSNCLYTDEFGYISLSEGEAKLIMPNIAFMGWVGIKIAGQPGEETLLTHFEGFESINFELQLRVLETPWHEHHRIHIEDLYPSDEDEEDMFEKPKDFKARQNNLLNIFGYYVGERSIFVKELPEKRFLIPVVDPEKLMPGVCYRIDAFWNKDLQAYIVSIYTKMVDLDTIQTREENGKILLVDTVNQLKSFPSVLKSSKYGIVDDPRRAMATHHLTRYVDSKCKVFIYEDDAVGTLGRFRIHRIDEDKANKMEKNLQEDGRARIEKATGIVVSRDGRIFCAAHCTLLISLPADTQIAVGKCILFSASRRKDDIFDIIDGSYRVVESGDVEWVELNGLMAFQTRIRYPDAGEKLPSVVSLTFGLLSDPMNKIPERKNNNPAGMWAWVVESGIDTSGIARVAQTPFFIVHDQESAPLSLPPAPTDGAGRELCLWLRNRDGIVTLLKDDSGKDKMGMEAGDRHDAITVSAPARRARRVVEPRVVERKACGCPLGSSPNCEAYRILKELMNFPLFQQALMDKGTLFDDLCLRLALGGKPNNRQ